MNEVIVRDARASEMGAIADLRLQWIAETGDSVAITRDAYSAAMGAFFAEHSATHFCMIALRGETVVGMAWLAMLPRVPTPDTLDRYSGDVQSVYVVPSERGSGVGGRLMSAIVDRAEHLGLGHVTVHSNLDAKPMYERHGFSHSPRMLLWEPAPRS